MSEEEELKSQGEFNSDEDEESDDNNEYVQDDFINDDISEEAPSTPKQPKPHKRKRKRSHRSDEEIDEDDLDLINEGKSRKNRKRLMKANLKEKDEMPELKDEDYEDEGEVIQDEFIEGGRPTHIRGSGEDIPMINEQLNQFNEIFGDSDEDEDIKPDEGKIEQDDDMHADAIEEKIDIENEEKWRNEVIKVDIPERLYIRLKGRLEPTDEELEEEAKWIYKTKKRWKNYHAPEEKVVASIKGVLKHFRKDKFDIPFLATYRCYLFQQELQVNDFYEIYEMDMEWCNFLKTKKAIEDRLDGIRTHIPNSEMIDE